MKRSPTTDWTDASGLSLPSRRRGAGIAARRVGSWAAGSSRIELQCVRKQEHSVDHRSALQVREMHRAELIDECARPVLEHVTDLHVVGDAEREVDV